MIFIIEKEEKVEKINDIGIREKVTVKMIHSDEKYTKIGKCHGWMVQTSTRSSWMWSCA